MSDEEAGPHIGDSHLNSPSCFADEEVHLTHLAYAATTVFCSHQLVGGDPWAWKRSQR
jgi:hypothetical protein